MEDYIKEEIINYISKRKVLTLATATLKGEPLTHPIVYINKGFNIYFLTGKQTRKVKNIQENPNVSYSIFDETEHLDEIRLVQIEGKAEIVTEKNESKEVIKMLKQKFPHMAEMPITLDSVVVKITPKIGYFSDYIKRFGHREKVEF